ncbi:MAG: M56 family metallopeptidase, partial [Lachnospiraceae bacterium]|nr:M56 family metallopeptidase [Lachnospiraceae bacterium]
MGYVLLMTLSGSALFIGYLCWEKVLGKSMTEAMKYGALIIVMLDYAVPWVWIKGIYRNVIGVFLSEDMPAGSKVLINVADIETNKAAYRTKEYQLLTFVVSIWFAVAAILLIIRIVKSLKKTHELHALAIRCEDENLERTLKHLRESIHYRRRPEIVWTRVNNETFTIGATRPIIFLQKEYAAGDLYWILKHEMTHIVRMDLWVKLLLEFVCCLHWFNPLIYLLERKIKYLSETSCDEKVINKCTEKEKRMYIDLLERNKGGNRMESPVNSALESGNRAIDQRISLMKNSRTIRPKEKVIVICIFGLLIILNSLTALAYPDALAFPCTGAYKVCNTKG